MVEGQQLPLDRMGDIFSAEQIELNSKTIAEIRGLFASQIKEIFRLGNLMLIHDPKEPPISAQKEGRNLGKMLLMIKGNDNKQIRAFIETELNEILDQIYEEWIRNNSRLGPQDVNVMLDPARRNLFRIRVANCLFREGALEPRSRRIPEEASRGADLDNILKRDLGESYSEFDETCSLYDGKVLRSLVEDIFSSIYRERAQMVSAIVRSDTRTTTRAMAVGGSIPFAMDQYDANYGLLADLALKIAAFKIISLSAPEIIAAIILWNLRGFLEAQGIAVDQFIKKWVRTAILGIVAAVSTLSGDSQKSEKDKAFAESQDDLMRPLPRRIHGPNMKMALLRASLVPTGVDRLLLVNSNVNRPPQLPEHGGEKHLGIDGIKNQIERACELTLKSLRAHTRTNNK